MRARLLGVGLAGADDPLSDPARRSAGAGRRHRGQRDRPSVATAGIVGGAGQRRGRPRARLRRREPGDDRPSSVAILPASARAGRGARQFRPRGHRPPLSPATRPHAGSACAAPRAITTAGFHATGTVGSFGAAAACARLLGLDADKTAQALGIAGTQAAGLKSQFGTMCKPFHAGKAAQNGLLAARLAARGFSSRADVIECAQGFARDAQPRLPSSRCAGRPAGRLPHPRATSSSTTPPAT